MGQSTDGIICYGIDLGESLPWSEDEFRSQFEELGSDFDDDEDDEVMAYLLGGLEPFKHEHDSNPETTPEWSEAWGKYSKERDRILEASQLKLVYHCSDGDPMYILAMRGTYVSALRGYPEHLNMGELMSVITKPGRMDKYLESARKLGVTNPEPKWLLCSYWG